MKELDRYISFINYFAVEDVTRSYMFLKTKNEYNKANESKKDCWNGQGWYDCVYLEDDIPVLMEVRQIIKTLNPHPGLDYTVFIDTEQFVKKEKEASGCNFIFPIFGITNDDLFLQYIVYSDELVYPFDVLENADIEPYAYGLNYVYGEWANFFDFELENPNVLDLYKWEYFIQKDNENLSKFFVTKS